MKFISLYLLLSFTFLLQSDWVLKKDKQGIKVFVREMEGSHFKELKVQLQCAGTLEKFKKVIFDVEKHKEWVYNTEKSELIQKINKNEFVYYTEIKIPWPVSNRDLTSHLRMITDSIPNTYFIKSKAVNNYVPEKSGIVRVKKSLASWTITQINENEINIEYVLRVNPAGNIPPWLVNLTATTGPYHTFSNLKDRLQY